LGLKKIHDFGYSHGDLKPENICARMSSKGQYKFTLIDLGMASKLPKIGQNMARKSFRGNYMFAHIN
jgi:serine/threonine protein kinase